VTRSATRDASRVYPDHLRPGEKTVSGPLLMTVADVASNGRDTWERSASFPWLYTSLTINFLRKRRQAGPSSVCRLMKGRGRALGFGKWLCTRRQDTDGIRTLSFRCTML